MFFMQNYFLSCTRHITAEHNQHSLELVNVLAEVKDDNGAQEKKHGDIILSRVVSICIRVNIATLSMATQVQIALLVLDTLLQIEL